MDQFQKKFLEEATDIINELEDALLLLEKNPTEKEIIERVFRAMHTLKGGGSMFGFTVVSGFTHHFETLFDMVRTGKRSITKELLDLTLESVDHIKVLLDENDQLSPPTKENNEKLIAILQKWIQGGEEKSSAAAAKADEPEEKNELKTYYIYFEPKSNIFDNGTNPLYLIDDLHAIGNCKAFPNLSSLPSFEDLDPVKCYTSWHIILATEQGANNIKDVFIFVEDDCRLDIVQLADRDLLQNKKFVTYIEEYHQKNNILNTEDLKNIIQSQFSVKSLKEKIQAVSKTPATSSSKHAQAEATIAKSNANISSIRVNSDKLDELMSLVSELVTTQARLTLYSENSMQAELSVITEELEKISRRLRDNVFSVRLVPLESVVTRFQRLVRELSNETGKEVDFVAEGTDTELDKNSIEMLVDPILHIIRNSMDHGLESTEDRIKAGKPAKGKITLKAFYSGTNVYLHIIDDGKGIDPEKIRQKAIERGLIDAEANLSERELLEMVFLPGFSTAQKITNLSGRGVGMDVVKRKMSELRGDVELYSKIGVGTTIALKLPLTLSIIDGLLVKVESTHYVIPLSSIDKCYEFEHSKLANAVNNLIYAGTDHIPFIHLRSYFDFKEPAPKHEQVVVVEYNNMKIGLAIDKVVGEYQAVLKPLGKTFKKQDIISGASILGDGTVALVLDTNKIIYQFSNRENMATIENS